MTTRLRKIIKKAYDKYLVVRSAKAFARRYKNISDDLFKQTLGNSVLKEYRDRWKVLGEKVEVKTFLLCYNLSGKIDYDIVPENIFASIIERNLNRYKETSFFEIKNFYNKWFENSSLFPKAYLHKIDGFCYDEKFNMITNLDVFLDSWNKFPFILKASKDTYGGADVFVVTDREGLVNGLNKYRNVVCQELIIQAEPLRRINSSSINTIRTCLYRHPKTGQFEVLNNSIRFGVNGSLDNETSGGIVCNINENGDLNSYAVNKYAEKFFSHPDSGISFQSVKIPFYQDLLEAAKIISNELYFCNLVSLDMCLDHDNRWRCIEVNLKGQTIRFAQYAGKGFFGGFTDTVIKQVLNAKGASDI